jgi:redox-sensitive bicupin YhaK (pirin superfamily)
VTAERGRSLDRGGESNTATVLAVAFMRTGERRNLCLRPSRHAGIHVARGSILVNRTTLAEGDGAAVSGEERLAFVGKAPAGMLAFDLA